MNLYSAIGNVHVYIENMEKFLRYAKGQTDMLIKKQNHSPYYKMSLLNFNSTGIQKRGTGRVQFWEGMK